MARARRRRPLSVEHRRARAMLVAAVAFAGIVLLTSFPLSELLAQRSALSSTAQKVSSFEAADQALSAQLAALDQTGAMGDLARRDYGFVADGQRAYDILPPPGGSAPTSLKSGYVPLEGPPVAPGSARSEALTGLPPSAPVHGVRTASVVAPGSGAGGGPPPGYWGRVLHSLEFWN